MSVSILSYIPSTQHAAIAARTSTYDSSGDFQNAIDTINAAGGGTLYIPAGKYRLNSTLTNKAGVCLLGDGPAASTLEWGSSHTGHGIQQLATINGSTSVNNVVEKIALTSLAGSASTGGGYYERSGTFFRMINCAIGYFKYGIILDQSELADIDLCDIGGSYHSCIWLVNGAETSLGNSGAQGTFTNRISVRRCQLNAPGQWCVLDDGGYAHSFIDNNFNGGSGHIRAAGVEGLIIQGGEFESASSTNIFLTYTRLSGSGVGACYVILIAGTFIAPTANNYCIQTYGAGRLTLIGNFFGNSSNASVPSVQCDESSMVFSIGNNIESSGPMFAGTPYGFRWSMEGLREGSATADVASIAPGASAFVNITVDSALGDWVDQVSTSVDLGDSISLSARVSAANTVRVKLTNTGSAAVDPPSCTYSVRVMRKQV